MDQLNEGDSHVPIVLVSSPLATTNPGDLVPPSPVMYGPGDPSTTVPNKTNIIVPSVNQQHGYANGFAKYNFRLQSMLRTMRKEHIRNDFLAGIIVNVQDHRSILLSLDIIHDILLPDWCVNSTNRERIHSAAVVHARALYDKAQENFPLGTSDGSFISCYTYAVWNEAIEEICNSPYWKQFIIDVSPDLDLFFCLVSLCYLVLKLIFGYQRNVKVEFKGLCLFWQFFLVETKVAQIITNSSL